MILNDRLNDIARDHSQAMAQGKIPFGSDGFDKRAERSPFPQTRCYSEGLACHSGTSNPAQAAFVSLSKNQQNILGTFNYTGIGVGMNPSNNSYYFTQIYVLANSTPSNDHSPLQSKQVYYMEQIQPRNYQENPWPAPSGRSVITYKACSK